MSSKEKFFENTSIILESLASNFINAKKELCRVVKEKRKQKLKEMHFVTANELDAVRKIAQEALEKVKKMEKGGKK